MNLLELPNSTIVNKAIPKNSFDKYTNTKQKKYFTDIIDKIRWVNKLAPETINLQGKEIKEIQVFEITLKKKEYATEVLQLIDSFIPYHIIFLTIHGNEVLFSTSQKHPHPTNENTSVIDWTFNSKWNLIDDSPYKLHLKQNLDFVYTDFCKQLAKKPIEKLSLKELILKEKKIDELNKSIKNLQNLIKSTKQFNKKVTYNLELNKKTIELKSVQGTQ